MLGEDAIFCRFCFLPWLFRHHVLPGPPFIFFTISEPSLSQCPARLPADYPTAQVLRVSLEPAPDPLLGPDPPYKEALC